MRFDGGSSVLFLSFGVHCSRSGPGRVFSFFDLFSVDIQGIIAIFSAYKLLFSSLFPIM